MGLEYGSKDEYKKMRVKVPEIKVSEESIGNIAVYFYLLLNFVIRIVSNSTVFLRLCLLLMLLSSLLSGIIAVKQFRSVTLYYILFVSSFIVEYVTKAGEWRYSLDYFVYTFSYMGIALMLVTSKQKVVLYRLLFYLVMLYLIVKVLVIKAEIRGLMLDGSSYNFISALALLYLGVYCIVLFQNDKEFSILQALTFFVVTTIAYGRGGILTGALFLVLTCGIKYLKTSTSAKKTVITVCVIALIILSSSYVISIIEESGYFAKFEQEGMDSSSRTDIWSGFLSNNLGSIKSFFLGSNPLLVFKDGNLHNSYLQMYASFGLPFFLINILMNIIFVLHYAARKNRNVWILAIYFTFFLRANLDKICFRGGCEILYFCFIFQLLTDCLKTNDVTKSRNEKRRVNTVMPEIPIFNRDRS